MIMYSNKTQAKKMLTILITFILFSDKGHYSLRKDTLWKLPEHELS